ncbi:unnamed protein product [Protopolystoma xenopodis]|uniref:Uncharacterized protein n=1 Tax=Protopolystoma xenopodis TaxID=117903 RepID=A0A448WRT6_9PLAT|nr:unnamed protein product [Protopolystoma xenopodis]
MEPQKRKPYPEEMETLLQRFALDDSTSAVDHTSFEQEIQSINGSQIRSDFDNLHASSACIELLNTPPPRSTTLSTLITQATNLDEEGKEQDKYDFPGSPEKDIFQQTAEVYKSCSDNGIVNKMGEGHDNTEFTSLTLSDTMDTIAFSQQLVSSRQPGFSVKEVGDEKESQGEEVSLDIKS